MIDPQETRTMTATPAKTAADFRIERVQGAVRHGKKIRVFDVFERRADGKFYFLGQLSAPARTPLRDLWKVAAER
jgi:hypothetical protein